MRKSVLALALAPALLAGCTYDSPKAAGGPESLSTASSGATGPAAPPDQPLAPTPGAPLLPGSTPNAPNQPAGAPPTTPNNGATASSFPGRPVPPIAALRTGWITATVTKGGSGPCFTMTSSDGVAYAAYSTLGLQLTTGSHVRARITPGKTPVSCGTGRAVKLDHVQLAG